MYPLSGLVLSSSSTVISGHRIHLRPVSAELWGVWHIYSPRATLGHAVLHWIVCPPASNEAALQFLSTFHAVALKHRERTCWYWSMENHTFCLPKLCAEDRGDEDMAELPTLSSTQCHDLLQCYRFQKRFIAFEQVWDWANRQIHRGECTSNVPTEHSFEFKCHPMRHSVMKFMQSLGYVTRHHHSNANADEPWPLLKTFRTKCLHPGSPRKAILLVHRPHCQSQEPLDCESDETYAQSAMQTYKTESEGNWRV